MQLSWTRLPFKFTNSADYQAKLTEYIGEVFYNRLPEVGYDVREEQIFTAYRIGGALAQGKLLLAEAGLGTGKTLAYLVPAVCHARLRGQPVVVASAGSVLQEQILHPQGDLATLSRALNLEVDARIAKDPTHYLCEVKLESLRRKDTRRKGLAKLLAWAADSAVGERGEVPDIVDETWKLVAWDRSLPCDTCPKRGFCRLTRAREQYRKAVDLVVTDHDLFFMDLWTRRERREAGLLPLLPPYSGVVFDEGHDIPDSAQLTAGHSLRADVLHRILVEAYENSDRKVLLAAVRDANRAAKAFWAAVDAAVVDSPLERLHMQRTADLPGSALGLINAVLTLQDELATEEAMHRESDEEVRLLALQAGLDALLSGLSLLRRPAEETVIWAERHGEQHHLWVVPRRVDRLLAQELYSQKVPVVLSSATLAAGSDFSYMKRLLGTPDALHAQVGTPFDLSEQALVYLPSDEFDPVDRLVEVLQATGGRALVLLPRRKDLPELREQLAGRNLPFPLIWEDEGERADLLRRFAAHIPAVLFGASYWEGIDVPGETLSCVVVMQLPFLPHDPVVEARRADAQATGQDPFAAVDVPAMAVKLKQGRGRLIRTATDKGVFALLDTSWLGTDYEDDVYGAFPEDAPETDDLGEVAAFLGTPRPR